MITLTGVGTTSVKKKLSLQIQLITSPTQEGMITTLVSVEPVKRISTKYQEGFTASAGENKRYVEKKVFTDYAAQST